MSESITRASLPTGWRGIAVRAGLAGLRASLKISPRPMAWVIRRQFADTGKQLSKGDAPTRGPGDVGVHDQRGQHAPPLQLRFNGLLDADAADSALGLFVAAAAAAFGVPDREPGLFLTAVDDTSIGVIAEALRRAVDAVHAEAPDTKAGITLSIQQAVAEPGGEQYAEAFDEQINRRFLREMGAVGDFVGIQNYTPHPLRIRRPLPVTGDVSGAARARPHLAGPNLPTSPRLHRPAGSRHRTRR